MKRFFILVLVALMALGIVACTDDKEGTAGVIDNNTPISFSPVPEITPSASYADKIAATVGISILNERLVVYEEGYDQVIRYHVYTFTAGACSDYTLYEVYPQLDNFTYYSTVAYVEDTAKTDHYEIISTDEALLLIVLKVKDAETRSFEELTNHYAEVANCEVILELAPTATPVVPQS